MLGIKIICIASWKIKAYVPAWIKASISVPAVHAIISQMAAVPIGLRGEDYEGDGRSVEVQRQLSPEDRAGGMLVLWPLPVPVETPGVSNKVSAKSRITSICARKLRASKTPYNFLYFQDLIKRKSLS